MAEVRQCRIDTIELASALPWQSIMRTPAEHQPSPRRRSCALVRASVAAGIAHPARLSPRVHKQQIGDLAAQWPMVMRLALDRIALDHTLRRRQRENLGRRRAPASNTEATSSKC